MARELATLHMALHRLTTFEQHADHVELTFDTPDGERHVKARYLLAFADGGRSLGAVSGSVSRWRGTRSTSATCWSTSRWIWISPNPRDYPCSCSPTLPSGWSWSAAALCWRFLYPLPKEAAEPTYEEMRDKAIRFIGEVEGIEVLGTSLTTPSTTRVAGRWRADPGVPHGRRRAPDHSDVGARPQHRRARRLMQPAVAARLGAARLGGGVCWPATRWSGLIAIKELNQMAEADPPP